MAMEDYRLVSAVRWRIVRVHDRVYTMVAAEVVRIG
jgi:hypothetical protein